MSAPLPYEILPETLRDGVQRYIESRIVPGGFLFAALKNDLRDAVVRADPENLIRLPFVVLWLVAHAPEECWGSLEAVAAWSRSNAREEDLL
jgi:hypothetical protein